jgi:hypothetical protein
MTRLIGCGGITTEARQKKMKEFLGYRAKGKEVEDRANDPGTSIAFQSQSGAGEHSLDSRRDETLVC